MGRDTSEFNELPMHTINGEATGGLATLEKDQLSAFDFQKLSRLLIEFSSITYAPDHNDALAVTTMNHEAPEVVSVLPRHNVPKRRIIGWQPVIATEEVAPESSEDSFFAFLEASFAAEVPKEPEVQITLPTTEIPDDERAGEPVEVALADVTAEVPLVEVDLEDGLVRETDKRLNNVDLETVLINSSDVNESLNQMTHKEKRFHPLKRIRKIGAWLTKVTVLGTLTSGGVYVADSFLGDHGSSNDTTSSSLQLKDTTPNSDIGVDSRGSIYPPVYVHTASTPETTPESITAEIIQKPYSLLDALEAGEITRDEIARKKVASVSLPAICMDAEVYGSARIDVDDASTQEFLISNGTPSDLIDRWNNGDHSNTLLSDIVGPVDPTYGLLISGSPQVQCDTAATLLDRPTQPISNSSSTKAKELKDQGFTVSSLQPIVDIDRDLAMPGDEGLVLLSGHHESGPAPYKDLDKLKKGDAIIITGDNGLVFTYIMESSIYVTNDQMGFDEIKAYTSPSGSNKIIALYTCEGNKRYVVFGVLAEQA